MSLGLFVLLLHRRSGSNSNNNSSIRPRAAYRYKKRTGTHTGILYRLMRTCVSYRLLPTDDPNNNKGWWHFTLCVDIQRAVYNTATSALVRPSVFGLRRQKCCHRSDFPFGINTKFGTRVYSISHVSAMLMRRSSLPSGNFGPFRCAFRKLPSIPGRTT